MALLDPIKDRLKFLRYLSPLQVKRLAQSRLSDLVLGEIGRSRARLEHFQQRFPSAAPRELAQHLIDAKKSLGGTVGGVTGVFGLFSVPADLVVMAYLQVSLLVDVATLYKVNLKGERARQELLDLFSYANGVGPLQRSGPRVLGQAAAMVLRRGGLPTLGRALPLVAAPLSAYLNNQHLQKVGEEAIRFYDGFSKAREKSRTAS